MPCFHFHSFAAFLFVYIHISHLSHPQFKLCWHELIGIVNIAVFKTQNFKF